MMYFDGFDSDGISCKVRERGNGIGYVETYLGVFPAVRLDASTYMAVNGRVYASSVAKCVKYSTAQWGNYAKQKMRQVGIRPEF